MNILHISDLHLGKVVNGFSMIEDQQHVLKQVIETIKSSNIDVLIIAGDVYDRAIAPTPAIEVWEQFLNAVVKLNIQTLVINGNHDSRTRLGFASKLLAYSNIHIVSEDILFEKISLDSVDFYLLPFINLELASAIIGQKVADFTDLKQIIVDQIELDESKTNVIVDHSYIITGENDIEQDSSVRPLALGGSEFTNGAVYSKFDLVLAGHVHRHAHLKPNIYYSGSILPYSTGEKNNKNGYYIHSISNSISSVYYQFDLLHPIRGVELLIDDISEHAYSEDYVVVKLLDEGQVVNPLDKIRVKYPNVMQITRDFQKLELDEIETAKRLDSLDQNFAKFYKLNSEGEISEQSLSYFMSIANKITKGDEDETT